MHTARGTEPTRERGQIISQRDSRLSTQIPLAGKAAKSKERAVPEVTGNSGMTENPS